MAWITKSELRRLVRQAARAEHRATEAEIRLDRERHENDRMVKHLVNMWLRHVGTFPLQSESITNPVTNNVGLGSVPEEIDLGELEATIAAGAEMGVSREEVVRMLRMEKGLPVI